jgi:hypothetical protein
MQACCRWHRGRIGFRSFPHFTTVQLVLISNFLPKHKSKSARSTILMIRHLAIYIKSTRLALQLLSVRFVNYPHYTPRKNRGGYFLSLPPCVRIGQFSRLLPSVDVVAVSQAPSPESNPNSPLPVTAMVVQYTTIQS